MKTSKLLLILGALALALSGSAFAQSSTALCKATAAAPANAEGSFRPLSCELDGDLRINAAGGSTTPSDNFANPTNAQNSAAFGLVWDGATWDRMAGNAAGGIFAQGPAANGSAVAGNPLRIGGVDSGGLARTILTDAGGQLQLGYTGAGADGKANTHLQLIAFGEDGTRPLATMGYVFNGGITWDRQRGDVLGTWVQGGIAHDSPVSTQKPLLSGGEARTTVPTAVADADVVRQAHDPYGHQIVRNDHLNRFRCTVTVSTATTIQALGGSCAAPGASLSLYVTDISFDASAAGIAADAFPTLKYGTGGTCGTGTTVFWGKLSAAAVAVSHAFATPLKIPANNEICWISSTAGSKFIVVSGFIAP